MTNSTVTREEFDELKRNFNNVMEVLESVGIKQKVEFSQFMIEEDDSYDDPVSDDSNYEEVAEDTMPL